MAFDQESYLQAKLQQLAANPEAAAAVGWTGGSTADLAAFMQQAGMTPEQHYQQYGINEGIYTPSQDSGLFSFGSQGATARGTPSNFTINADGTVTRAGTDPNAAAGEMYGSITTPVSINSLQDPAMRDYFMNNPTEFFAYQAMGMDPALGYQRYFNPSSIPAEAVYGTLGAGSSGFTMPGGVTPYLNGTKTITPSTPAYRPQTGAGTVAPQPATPTGGTSQVVPQPVNVPVQQGPSWSQSYTGSGLPNAGMLDVTASNVDYGDPYYNAVANYYQSMFNTHSGLNVPTMQQWYSGGLGTIPMPNTTTTAEPTATERLFSDYLNSSGGGSGTTATGTTGSSTGQGVSQTATASALSMMSLAENPAIQAISPVGAALLGMLGQAIADGQIDANSEAFNSMSQAISNAIPGIAVVSDEQGNIVTVSTNDTIAMADQAMFGGSGGYGGGYGGATDSGDGTGGGFGVGSVGGSGAGEASDGNNW